MKNWVESILGAGATPAKSNPVRCTPIQQALGEAGARPEAEDVLADTEPPAAPMDDPDEEQAVGDVQVPAGGDVQALAAEWQSGGRVSVAQRVLGGLNSYTDLVSLIFSIGQDGAQELGRLMDELSAGQTPEDQETEDHPLDNYLDRGERDYSEPPAAAVPGRNLYNEQ